MLNDMNHRHLTDEFLHDTNRPEALGKQAVSTSRTAPAGGTIAPCSAIAGHSQYSTPNV
jgi:hypothetical protein